MFRTAWSSVNLNALDYVNSPSDGAAPQVSDNNALRLRDTSVVAGATDGSVGSMGHLTIQGVLARASKFC